jgi:translation initiation factor IF-1
MVLMRIISNTMRKKVTRLLPEDLVLVEIGEE